MVAFNEKRPEPKCRGRAFRLRVILVCQNEQSSSGRTRTYDPAVNSRLLYQLSYRGMCWNVRKSNGLCSVNQDPFPVFLVRRQLEKSDDEQNRRIMSKTGRTLSPHAPEHRFRRDASSRT